MKILAVDIETKPHLVYVWDLWNQNVGLNQIVKPGGMMCWAAKWLGEDHIEFRSEHHDGHSRMVKRAWKLLNEADAVLHFNGKRFDVPHIQREFAELGLGPTSPFQQIDLWKVAKAQFKFPSNKLAYISPRLGLEDKVKHEGFGLWTRCMAGDRDAWASMRDYNEQDVLLLEQLYERLLPWITNHPSYGAFSGENVCPNCGSADLQRRGEARTRVSVFHRFVCKRCGKWSRATKRVAHTGITEVAA